MFCWTAHREADNILPLFTRLCNHYLVPPTFTAVPCICEVYWQLSSFLQRWGNEVWTQGLSHLCIDHGDSCHGGNHGANTALAITAAKFVITFLSPGFSPGILDDPIRLVAQTHWCEATGSITNNQYSVIDVPLAAYKRARYSSNEGLHECGIDAHWKQQHKGV